MKNLIALAQLIDRLNGLVGKAMGGLVLAAILISAGNAVVRKLFNMSSNGWLEIQWYLFGTVFLLGAAYTLREGAHVRIDILASRFTPRARALVDAAGYLLFVLPLVGFVTVHGWEFFYLSWQANEMSPDAGGLVRWPAKLMIVLGFALLGLQVVSEMIKTFHRLAAKE
ncbi:TRAP transporter small permease subunit [Limnobacter sp.]|uniref:TRAP transporter small permease subunit n=1 Tax=Limnobacter sp. TaxID=2003368 RepID=UPI003514DF30